MAVAGGGLGVPVQELQPFAGGPSGAYSIEQQNCRFVGSEIEWALRLKGFKAGQEIFIYLKDSKRSVWGSKAHVIEDNHARGEEMVIREPASIFDPAQRENYQFWYALSVLSSLNEHVFSRYTQSQLA